MSEEKTLPYSILPICPHCSKGPLLDGNRLCQVCQSVEEESIIEELDCKIDSMENAKVLEGTGKAIK